VNRVTKVTIRKAEIQIKVKQDLKNPDKSKTRFKDVVDHAEEEVRVALTIQKL